AHPLLCVVRSQLFRYEVCLEL
ncbi:hypothetical protein CSUI_008614, partial [Cystoisospora suis]